MILLELLLVLFPFWIGIVEMEVTCTVPTKHIIMGEILTLYCNTSEISCFSCSELWFKEDSLLSFGEAAKDRDKYTVKLQKDGFTLEIKNTTFDDFDVEYKCGYGFSSCTTKLTLPASFEYHPRQDTIEKKVSVADRTLLFDVVFKAIHPIPVCSIHLDEENLSSSVKIETVKTGYLYKVNMNLNHRVKPDQCQGRVLVNCTTGTKEDTIADAIVSFECSGGRDLVKVIRRKEIMMIIIALVCVVVISIIVFFVMARPNLCMKLFTCCTKCKRSTNKREHDLYGSRKDLEIGMGLLAI